MNGYRLRVKPDDGEAFLIDQVIQERIAIEDIASGLEPHMKNVTWWSRKLAGKPKATITTANRAALNSRQRHPGSCTAAVHNSSHLANAPPRRRIAPGVEKQNPIMAEFDASDHYDSWSNRKHTPPSLD